MADMKPPKAPSLRMEAPLGALTLEREEMLSRAQIEQMRAGLGAAGPLAQAVLNGNAAGLVGTLPVGVVAPTGAVMAFAAATAWGPPDGWLECNGATVSKQQYPALFNVIGATYGSTDTTFNLPTITQIGSNIKYVVKT